MEINAIVVVEIHLVVAQNQSPVPFARLVPIVNNLI
jgi:hypothetical protein